MPVSAETLDALVRELQGKVAALEGGMLGDLKWKVTDTVDAGWLFANAQQVTASYPLLRAKLVALGNPHGTAGGNPLLPDLRGKFAAGAGGAYALGAAGGADSVTLTGAQSGVNGNGVTGDDSPDHSHNPGNGQNFLTTGAAVTWPPGAGGGSVNIASPTTTGASARHQHALASRGADSSHENRPPYVALWPFVKAS